MKQITGYKSQITGRRLICYLLSITCYLIIVICYLSCPNPFIQDIFTVTDPDAVYDHLLRRRGGLTEDDPVTLRIKMDISGNNWFNIFYAIGNSGKYVNLDLSACKPDKESENPILYDGIFDPSANNGAMDFYSYIVSITLPDAAVNIKAKDSERGAFAGFNNLRHVTGNNVLEIGNYAFQYIERLKSIDFPKATEIGAGAFLSNSELESINIPSAVTIEFDAFSYCINLISINLPNVTYIGNSAFAGCDILESVSMPKVQSIEINAFSETNLTSITIPSSCTFIGGSDEYLPGAFENCYSLYSVTFLGRGCIIQNDGSFPQGGAGAISLKDAYDEGGAGTYYFTMDAGWVKQ